jgi:hypothetical protein
MLKALAAGLLALLSSAAALADTHIVTADLPPFSIADHPTALGLYRSAT